MADSETEIKVIRCYTCLGNRYIYGGEFNHKILCPVCGGSGYIIASD